MSNQQVHQVRQELEDVLSTLALRAVPSLELPTGDAHEQALSETEIDLTVEAANVQRRTAKDVQTALRRIETSSYGLCETCGAPIATARLRALPWASRCVSCQSAVEAESQSDQAPLSPWAAAADAFTGGLQ